MKFNPKKLIGLETPRNQSQSKKFKNITIRRHIEYNTNKNKSLRSSKNESYLDLFKFRQTISGTASRNVSSENTPKNSRRINGFNNSRSPQRSKIDTSPNNLKKKKYEPKNRFKKNDKKNKKKTNSYLLKFLKHNEIGDKGENTFMMKKENGETLNLNSLDQTNDSNKNNLRYIFE